MAIRGSLSEVGLPDVLQLLSMGAKTGCLSVTDRSHFGYIYFDRGRICYASIVNRRDRLGDLLVKNGLVSHQELASAIDEQFGDRQRRLGEILVTRGAISHEQLEQFIRMQIEEAVYFLFTWTQGTFFFEADQRPEAGALLVSINPENLLLEGARRIDEWSLIEKKIPSLDLIFQLDTARPLPEDLTLTEDQRRILPLLDGQHSVAEVIEETGLVDFDAGKALFGLIQAGFAMPVGRRQPQPNEPIPSTRIEEHRNLGTAFYRSRMYDEAIREFRRVLELRPNDLEARFLMALIDLRRGEDRGAIHQLRQLLERGGPRAAAFLDLALALERMGRIENARIATEEALRLAPTHPGVLLSHAILLLKLQRASEAAAAFARYREAIGAAGRPPAAYYAFALLAEAACGRLEEARRLGEEGIQRFPHSAPVLLHLGLVHERGEEWDAAEALYRRACEEDSTLPQAQKALGDALYRRGALPEAAEAYRYAIHLAPDLGDDVYVKLGNLEYKRMEREEAVRLWQRALQLNPHNAEVRAHLEVVEGALGRGAAAALPAERAAGPRFPMPDEPAAGSGREKPGDNRNGTHV